MRIKKGLDVPISGRPAQSVSERITTQKVAIIGPDYVEMKPTMLVKEGDLVKAGQVLFTCKKVEGVRYCAPASGKILAVNRGAKRAFLSVEIAVDGNQQQVTFEKFARKNPSQYSFEEVRDLLNEAGLWAALRTRPYSKAPALDSRADAIFITTTDTNPLAADPAVVLEGQMEPFKLGVEVLARLTEGKTFVCKSSKLNMPGFENANIKVENFDGVHPAGNVGTHIHFLNPVSAKKTVWHMNYQDVVAVGHLFEKGHYHKERVISLAGPGVQNPRLIKTNLGACLTELTQGQLTSGENRVISGSVLRGSSSEGVQCYLGRFHNQVSVIQEGRERELFGWQSPGLNKFSVKNIYLSKLLPSKLFNMTTTTNGSLRAMVPVGAYEKVMPLDVLPTQLLRSLLTKDTDQAQKLGCLELDEEDLSLCTFVCPGKIDYGPVLRESLTTIEKEG